MSTKASYHPVVTCSTRNPNPKYEQQLDSAATQHNRLRAIRAKPSESGRPARPVLHAIRLLRERQRGSLQLSGRRIRFPENVQSWISRKRRRFPENIPRHSKVEAGREAAAQEGPVRPRRTGRGPAASAAERSGKCSTVPSLISICVSVLQIVQIVATCCCKCTISSQFAFQYSIWRCYNWVSIREW